MPRYQVKASIVVVDGSLCSRLLQFYVDNPGEELTMGNVATKFDVSMQAARSAVYRLVSSGALESTRVIRLASPKANSGVESVGLHAYDLGET